jgi:hypothetical protein
VPLLIRGFGAAIFGVVEATHATEQRPYRHEAQMSGVAWFMMGAVPVYVHWRVGLLVFCYISAGWVQRAVLEDAGI